jgi:hypothetical protein
VTHSVHPDQPPRAPAAEASMRPLIWTVCALAVSTVALIIIGNGNPVLAVVPLGGLLFLLMLGRMPLRWPVLVMVFCGITLENPGDAPAEGKWKSPLYPLGALLMAQLKQTIPVGALVITGIDVLLILLTGIMIHRRITSSTIDNVATSPTPRPLVYAAWICLGGTVLIWMFGLATGGSFRFSLWQVQRIIYLPLMFLFLQAIVPGARSQYIGARFLLSAAALKACVAIYVHNTVSDITYSTTHPDSMLFAGALTLLIVTLFEKPNRESFGRFALLAPLLIGGMVANNRRLVWVELTLSLVFMTALTRLTPLKRKIIRGFLVILPIIPVYLAAGWNHPTGVFGPVRTVRSVIDSKSDGSTEWRDLENYNLFSTIKNHPVAGTGFGHPYEQVLQLPDVSSVYELEPYCPHNSVLGLWAYTGFIGFSAIWSLVGVGMYFAGRILRLAREPDDRIAALGCIAIFVIYMFHCYGDMGLGTWMSVFLVSFALTIVSKMATRLGAWPGAAPALAPPPPDVRAMSPYQARLPGN